MQRSNTSQSTTSSEEEEEVLAVWGLTSDDMEVASTLEGVSYDVICAWCEPGTSGSHGICADHSAELRR